MISNSKCRCSKKVRNKQVKIEITYATQCHLVIYERFHQIIVPEKSRFRL